MSYVLFLIYLLLFSWLLTKSRFVMNAGLSSKTIIALFVLKVLTGCVHAWILLRMSDAPDTMIFHKEGLLEYKLLFASPAEYFTNLFHSGYSTGYQGLFGSTNSYWNDLTSNIIIKFLSICDVFSFGHYYVNVIFYNAAIFFGAIALFRVFNAIFPGRPALLIISCFLLPSLLFFSSTIHKEGIILAATGVAIFNIYAALRSNHFTLQRILYILLALTLMFFQRNYVLLAFLPAAVAWVISFYKKSITPMLVFTGIYIIGAFIFFSASSISPVLDLPAAVSNKQWAFQHLATPSTYLQTDSLAPNVKGFLKNAPQALQHSLLRPYFTDISLSRSLLPLAIELFCYQLLFILFIFFRNNTFNTDPFIFFGYFFSFSILLIIGYTVPVIGAIVRYRSILLPFILTPVLCNINWTKALGFFNINK